MSAAGWRERVAALRRETLVLASAARDPRTPWIAKALALAVVAYLFSPIDLVPDALPVIGLLDDLVIVPALIVLARRAIPAAVIAEHRARAASAPPGGRTALIGAAIVVVLWVLSTALVVALAVRVLG